MHARAQYQLELERFREVYLHIRHSQPLITPLPALALVSPTLLFAGGAAFVGGFYSNVLLIPVSIQLMKETACDDEEHSPFQRRKLCICVLDLPPKINRSMYLAIHPRQGIPSLQITLSKQRPSLAHRRIGNHPAPSNAIRHQCAVPSIPSTPFQ